MTRKSEREKKTEIPVRRREKCFNYLVFGVEYTIKVKETETIYRERERE